jgi:hypothetical protein
MHRASDFGGPCLERCSTAVGPVPAMERRLNEEALTCRVSLDQSLLENGPSIGLNVVNYCGLRTRRALVRER